MFDVIIFLILPVHMMVMLPVMFTPANPSFSLCYENKWMDCSFPRNLHDDSSIDGISICEGILAVDGIIFNWEICDGHFPQRKLKLLVKHTRNSSLVNHEEFLFAVYIFCQASKSCSTCFSCLRQQVRNAQAHKETGEKKKKRQPYKLITKKCTTIA